MKFEDNTIHYFDITCPIMYTISDNEGADKICGHYVCHNIGQV